MAERKWQCQLCDEVVSSRLQGVWHTLGHDPWLMMAFALATEEEQRKIRREVQSPSER